MSKELNIWENAKINLEECARWNDLPNGDKYLSSTFEISVSHSKVKLTRCGQQSCGGQNYWESPEALNRALLEHIKDNWQEIWPHVLARLKKKESDALKDCQDFVTRMQELIDNEGDEV